MRLTTILTANGQIETTVHEVNLSQANGRLESKLQVVLGHISIIDVLIGMDIITLADFAVTNKDGQTWVAFAVPSRRHLDFESKWRRLKSYLGMCRR